MKQTNNAIKFLMAQYRAIFQNAYFKGLATAAVVTMGLAAGQAQATALDNSGLADLKELITIDGESGSDGTTNNTWEKLTVSGAGSDTAIPVDLKITGGAKGDNYITSDDTDDAVVTGKALTIEVKADKAKDNGLTIKAGAQSGAKAVFTDAYIKIGSLDINAADSTKAGALEANTITIGSAPKADAKAAPATPNAYVTLGKSGSLGIEATDSGDLSKLTTLTLNTDGQIKAVSGDTVTNTIHAAKLNINGGSILVEAKDDGSSGSQLTLNISEGSMKGGNLSITSGASATLNFITHEITDGATQKLDKSFDAQSGELVLGDTLTVSGDGVLKLNGAKSYATTEAKGIKLTGKARYETSLADLKGLLTGKNGTEEYAKDAKSGSLVISGGTLAITGSGTVELNKDLTFANNNTAAAGTIATSSNAKEATLEVENLLITGAVQSGDKLAVVGKNLTLTSADAAGVESLSAQNVTFGDGSKAYDLKDDLNLSATKEIADPYKTDGSKATVADTGTMTNAVTLANSKKITIAAGNYKSNGAITLSGGTIEVGTGTSGVDAKLELNSSDTLKLDNGAANTITIQGNGELSFKPDSVSNKEQSTGILDISAGELEIVGNASNETTITAHNHGALIVNEDQALDLINMSTTPRKDKGAAVLLSGSGAFVVKGNLTGIDGIDVAKIKAGTAASGDKVVLSGSDNVVSANNAWFTDSGTNGLQLGNGNTLDIEQTLTLDATSGGSGADFTVKNGTLLVGQSLTSNNTDKTIVIGNDQTKAASLQLGIYEVETDAYGYDTTAGLQGKLESHSAETGSVGVNLKLDGKDKTDSANLNVVFGKWSAKDITAANAKIAVGESGTSIQYPEGAAPSLTAGKLTLGQDASLTVNAGTDATFDALTMNGTSGSKMEILGKVTVNGLEKVTDGNQEAGYNVTAGDITVKGRDASLTLGSKALADLDFAGTTLDSGNKYLNNIALDEYAVLKLDLADTVSLTKDNIVELRKEFIKGNTSGTALTSGYIHLGAAQIDGLTIDKDTNTIQWSNYKDFSDIQGGTFKDILTEDLTNAKLVVTKDNASDTIQANVGSIDIAANSITLGDSTLHNAAGNNGSFITNSTATGEDKTVGTATVAANATVGLYNGGKLGNVKLTSGSATTSTVLNIVSDKADTNLTSITGADNTVVNVDGKTVVEKDIKNVSKLVVNKDLTVAEGKVEVGFLSNDEGKVATLAAKNLTVKGDASNQAKNIEFGGNLVVTNKAQFQDDTVLTGAANVVKTLEFDKNAKIAAGITVADTLSMKGAKGTELFVGTPATADDAGNNAVLVVNKLDLQGATLTADPSFDKPANIVIAQQLGSATIVPGTGAQAGSLNGTIQTLQNSIVAVGVSVADKDQAIAKAKVFDSLMTANGSLQADKVGAISYVAQTLDLAANAKLRTAKQNAEEFKNILAANTDASNADIYIGDNAALAVDIDALNAGRGAIKFATDDAKVYAANADSSKVLIAGKLSSLQGQIDLFDTATSTGKVTLQGANTLTVQTINGLYAYTLSGDALNNAFDLEFQIDKANQDFDVVSTPVKDTLIAAGTGFIDYAGDKKTPVLGAVAAGYSYDSASGKLMLGDTEVTDTKELAKFDLTNSTKDVVYYNSENALLEGILTLGNNAVDAETNARLAVFGGAPQAAIEAGASTYEAISARMGVGVSGVSAAANGQGGAIWVTPVYKSAESDGFNADNKSYGADVTLYGLALGADIEVAPNFKVGGMFNVGSGDADGQGLGSNVSNDFDYYGLGLYAGYSMDALSLVADLTYTAVDNDIEGNTDLGKVTTSIDSTNLSVGVTGQYKLSLAGMDVTPHAGLRYSMIDMDDYSTAYSQNDSDSLNIFSVPVGVTIAKEYVTDTWTVKPSFDLTLTGNFGDDEAEATAKWNGFSNLSTTVKSEIMDNFTYGAAVGVSATSGNFGLGLGVNYTGSSNTDEFGVNANARYMF